MIPGLIDSHSHPIRGGLYYNLELRWDGVPSLADALRMLREQAQRTPPNQWVRVVGGWSEFQFAERRMPTLAELNAAAPDTPVFVLNLYATALLNRAALRAAGYTRDTPNPPGGEIERDKAGDPTGLLVAKPNAFILYSTLAKGPKLPFEQQVNSIPPVHARIEPAWVTSVIDAGGGFQNYPQDYEVITALHKDRQMTVRIAASLFTQRPKQELEDFSNWTKSRQSGAGRRHVSHQRRGRDARLFSCGLRRFSRAASRHAVEHGKRFEKRRHAARAKPLAVPYACNLQRDH